MLIKNILKSDPSDSEIKVHGWIKTARQSKNLSFFELTDGSTLESLQVILNPELKNYSNIIKAGTGASLEVVGNLVASPGQQKVELIAQKVDIIGPADETYILQKKRHSFEFLREIAHFRPRTNTLSAVFRVRSKVSYAIHKFFHERDFVYLNSPIVTASDCEGAGELFQVSTLDMRNPPKINSEIDYSQDFFGQKAYLTVSGQLQAEIFAQAFKNAYTFGPTFRAENSNTSRHSAEFWMIEPEMAFCDLKGNLKLAEEFIKYIVSYILEHCDKDIEFFTKWINKDISTRLNHIKDSNFEVIEYTKAVEILNNSGKKFDYPVKWGSDFQSEHEKYITEEHVKKPCFIINYPKIIKPFYMRVNDDDKTVRAMDLLVPGVGEIIGGSQREDRYDILLARMQEQKMDIPTYQWYLDLRKYGSTPHSGFGLGLERLLMYITGMENIRDLIPFPRTPKNICY